MEKLKEKRKYGMTREQERAASRYLGQHVSRRKALCSVLASLLVCLLPMLVGLRLWEEIPEIVRTGLIDTEGADDSMPRAVLVFGVPGLMAVLNLVCHAQLWLHQKAERLPPMSVRLLGRWGIPVIAALLCPFWMLRAAAQSPTAAWFIPCVPALLLLLIGAHFLDLPRGEKTGLRLKCILYKEDAWRKTHTLGGVCWMLAGLLLLALYYGTGSVPVYSVPVLLLLLLAPLPAAVFFGKA
jgi:hypothetical protein